MVRQAHQPPFQLYASATSYAALFYKKGYFMYNKSLRCLRLSLLILPFISTGVLAETTSTQRPINEIIQLAERGDPNQQFELADLYRYGNKVPLDYVEAMKWYEKVAQNPQASDELKSWAFGQMGEFYQQGKGVARDIHKATDYYVQAFSLGNDRYYAWNAGVLFEEKQDFRQAAEYYKKAVQLKYPKSYVSLGKLYSDGKGVAQDYAQAAAVYEQGLKDYPLRPELLVRLGWLYEKGYGVAKNGKKALELYEEAYAEYHAPVLEHTLKREPTSYDAVQVAPNNQDEEDRLEIYKDLMRLYSDRHSGVFNPVRAMELMNRHGKTETELQEFRNMMPTLFEDTMSFVCANPSQIPAFHSASNSILKRLNKPLMPPLKTFTKELKAWCKKR